MNDDINDDINAPQQPETPAAPASEAAYIGAMLAGKVDIPHLDDEEFLEARHQWIHEAAKTRLQSGEPFAVSLIVEDLATAGKLTMAGGPQYLSKLANQAAELTEDVIAEHAANIRIKSTARKLQHLGGLMQAPGNDLNKALFNLATEAENLKSRLSISRLTKLTSASKLRAKYGDQEWLWPGYIPIGHITCIVSQQGQGKSNVALDICHRLITGAGFPDGQEPGIRFDEKDRILYLDSEGFLQGILSRLESWGTPDEQFLWPEGCDEKRWELNTPRGWNEFESIVAQFRPRLVIIDSLSGANSLEEKDNDQMKTVLLNLVALAKKFKLALILIHHLRKAGVGEPSYPIDLDRSRGASTITQFPRVVLAIGTPDRTQETSRRLDVIKNNLCAFLPALGFQIFETGLAWGDTPEPPTNFKPKDGARNFLLKCLTGVERKLVGDILDEGAQAGFSQRTIYRAKDDIGIRVSKEPGQNGRTFWSLANQAV